MKDKMLNFGCGMFDMPGNNNNRTHLHKSLENVWCEFKSYHTSLSVIDP